MIEFKNVSFCYEKEHPVLKNMSFSIEKGEAVGLIGANGAGKSSMLKVLLGLLPHEGEILVNGIPLCKQNLAEIRRILGFVLQNSDNQMFMPTVYDDMMFGLLNYGMSKEDAEHRVDAVLEQLDLTQLKNKYNHKISGGEKRMAAIATVLAMEPEVIIMDEPSVSLDPYNRRAVINVINSLTQTKIIASHDLDMIMETCRRVILISDGQIVASGAAMEILRNKELLENNRMELPFGLASAFN
ncbi:MAG: energy-coupling factor ABC transporter ATP-binding protein [Oscillospiraceae bacterium]|nr:energy-coupling factor ABC transporter ATP-binding protein [Oscillospiraceae bacterium]